LFCILEVPFLYLLQFAESRRLLFRYSATATLTYSVTQLADEKSVVFG
jgi:hypothetical protein